MPSSKRRKLKVVLDSNLWVSAVIWGGLPAKIIEAAEEGKIIILLSAEILSEISRVLNYDKLRRIYEEAGLNRREIIATVARIGKVVEVTKKLNIVREDPSDNKFIECAVDGDASYLVSGDEHLLRINLYGKIKIVSATEFMKFLQNHLF